MTAELIAAAIVVRLFAAPVAGQPMSMDDAVHFAERNAFAVQLQSSKVEQSRQLVNTAIGELGPKLGLTGSYTRFGSALYSQFNTGQAPIVVQPVDEKSITATLQLPLDISGAGHLQVLASQAQLAAAKQSLSAAMNDARLSARSAFLNVLHSQDLVRVAQEELADSQAALNQGKLQLQEKQAAKVDVDRFAAQVAQSQADVIAAQNSLSQANYAFNIVLGRAASTPVVLKPIAGLPIVAESEQSLLSEAFADRPDLRALVQAVRAQDFNRRIAEKGSLQPVDLNLSFQQNINAQGFSARDNLTTAAISVSIALYDAGLVSANRKGAEQAEKQARIQYEEGRIGVTQDVANAIANLDSSLAEFQNAEKQLKLAQEVFRLAGIRQAAGFATTLDVIDAETALTQARVNLSAARYSYLTAYSQLQHAVANDDISTTKK